jgi:hypothetical protein
MNRNKIALGVAILFFVGSAQAEIAAIDDEELAGFSGQSGLLVEAGFGGAANKTNILQVDWSTAGITVEAFKWEVDLEDYNSSTNLHSTELSGEIGGFIAQRILVAGQVDVVIDMVRDTLSPSNAIGFDFQRSNVDVRFSNMAFYSKQGGIGESMGAVEVLTLNIDGMDLFISGRGAANP